MRKSGSVTDPQEVLVRASRRDFIKLAGVGGVVLVSGFGLRSYAAEGGARGSQLGSAAGKTVGASRRCLPSAAPMGLHRRSGTGLT